MHFLHALGDNKSPGGIYDVMEVIEFEKALNAVTE